MTVTDKQVKQVEAERKKLLRDLRGDMGKIDTLLQLDRGKQYETSLTKLRTLLEYTYMENS
jgi:hypothetical protein